MTKWRLSSLFGTALVALACATSPIATSPAPTAPPTPGPTPDINAPYPAKVAGLPVMTVQAASQLLLDGRLDGRLAAVAGYWITGMPFGCPYTPFAPMLSTRCSSDAFADEHLRLGSYSEGPDGSISYTWSAGRQRLGLLIPVLTSESSNGTWPEPAPGPPSAQDPTPARRVVLIGHAGDPRLWQCRPADRDECGQIFVVDRIAWVDGVDLPLTAGFSEVDTALTLDQAIAASGVAPESVVSAYPLVAASLGDVDPRLVGVDGEVVWAIRVAMGLDAAGAAAARSLVVDDANRTILRTVPLETGDDYVPALLTIYVDDSRTPSGGEWGYSSYLIADSDGREVRPQSAAVALAPGSYSLSGFIRGDLTSPPPGPPCQTDIDLVANQDLWMTVSFARDGSCTWAVSEPLF